MNKLIIPAISIKSIISIFITYLILFNGNAGSLIHYIGLSSSWKLHHWLSIACKYHIIVHCNDAQSYFSQYVIEKFKVFSFNS